MMQKKEIIIKADREIKELIPYFLNNRNHDLARLQKALNENSFEFIKTIGHRMQGDSGAYGFDGLVPIGRNLEQAALQKDKAAIVQAIAGMREYLTQVKVVYENPVH